ncbi:hypothetical protein HW555_006526 [Spodoptera exigua]|uniref:Uncharacterized protein n=1 Tax=Spodoptera exigua TaxID=7107 RepID=A0A835GHT4_SPOEX|nr:hypothetical protein HW555_006526 [Spodoptera exigua]
MLQHNKGIHLPHCLLATIRARWESLTSLPSRHTPYLNSLHLRLVDVRLRNLDKRAITTITVNETSVFCGEQTRSETGGCPTSAGGDAEQTQTIIADALKEDLHDGQES